MLTNEFGTFLVIEQIQQGNTEIVDEVMQLMRRFSR